MRQDLMRDEAPRTSFALNGGSDDAARPKNVSSYEAKPYAAGPYVASPYAAGAYRAIPYGDDPLLTRPQGDDDHASPPERAGLQGMDEKHQDNTSALPHSKSHFDSYCYPDDRLVPARDRPSPLTPQSWQEAEKLAKLLCKTKLVPQGFESPDLCLIAIMQGMEMGLPPMMALQRMALVEGKLTLWGDGALALVLKSGLCTSMTEWMDVCDQNGDPGLRSAKDQTFNPGFDRDQENWVAHCEVQRLSWPEPIIRSFSVRDAKRAGLWQKEGPWMDYPKRMLQMRARAFALRDVFADVLGGLYLREEIELRGQRGHEAPGYRSQGFIPKTPSAQNPAPKNHCPQCHNTENHTPTRDAFADQGQETPIAQSKASRHRSHSAGLATSDDRLKNQTNASPSQKSGEPEGFSGIGTDHREYEYERDRERVRDKARERERESEDKSLSGPPTPTRRKAPPPPESPVIREGLGDDPLTHPHKQSFQGSKETAGRPESHPSLNGDPGDILARFHQSLGACNSHAELEACRIRYQPELDLLGPEDLDLAAQAYLVQEERIESLVERPFRIPNLKRRRALPQIRRWKAQYRPYQRRKSAKADKNNEKNEEENSFDKMQNDPDP